MLLLSGFCIGGTVNHTAIASNKASNNVDSLKNYTKNHDTKIVAGAKTEPLALIHRELDKKGKEIRWVDDVFYGYKPNLPQKSALSFSRPLPVPLVVENIDEHSEATSNHKDLAPSNKQIKGKMVSLNSVAMLAPLTNDLLNQFSGVPDDNPINSECITAVNQGDAKDQLDVVFIADGYDNFDEFLADVDRGIELFGKRKPFSEEYLRMNFHYLSEVEDLDCGKWSNPTELGGAASVCSYSKTLKAASVCPHDLIMVYSRNLDGGLSVWGSGIVFIDHPDWTIHETAHAFGSLGDEYPYYMPYWPLEFPNCSQTGTTDSTVACEKWTWAESINPEIGCYPGCGFMNLYRPVEEECGMRYISTPFDTVCYNHLHNLLVEYGTSTLSQ